MIRPVPAEGEVFDINDGKARLIGIPLISLIMHLIFHDLESGYEHINHVQGFFISFIYTLTYWEGIRHIWSWLQKKHAHYSQTKVRLIKLITAVLLYGIAATVVIKYLGLALFGQSCTLEMMVQGYFIGLIPTILVLMVYEAVYFFESWKNKVKESEAISRTQLVNQLEALKAQLDPHFLFNSLNTLSSLIDENEPAQQYLSRLSDVYRYVLLSKDRTTVTLKEEMEFVNAFLYLAQVRFQSGLEVDTQISSKSWNLAVAPLSIQLLVENALKHNVISRQHPLKITIRETDGYLWVSNAIHKKEVLEPTTKVGLKNILEQYKLLSELPVHIYRDALRFEVALPLLPA
jgi:sensor histidine kinase YesM